MAGYDRSLDKELAREELDFETTKIIASVMSYNEGEKKLQLSRENLNPETGEWRWSKLGRLNKREVEGLIPILEKLKENM
jgi:hypothetical protein